MASSGDRDGDAPRRRSITGLFRSKKTVSTTHPTTTPTTTLSTTTPTTTPSVTHSPTITPYAQQIFLTPQYDGPRHSYHQPMFHHTSQPDLPSYPHTLHQTVPQQHMPESSTHVTRRYIEPDGHTFNPHGPPSHEITNIIRSNFSAPYVSWKKIPQEVRDMWFREFERAFQWLPEHHYIIHKNFESGGSKRFRDLSTNVRVDGEKPDWIDEGVCAGLNKKCSSPAYLQRRAQNKQNRASDCGGLRTSLSTGGSVPHTELKRRLEKELGRVPTMSELHTRTHQKQRTK